MRKIKVYLTLTAIAACMLAFTGCGTENNNETGSNTDTQRNNESTGVIEEAVTGVIDGVEEIVTGAADGIKDIATGAANGLDEIVTGADMSVNEHTDRTRDNNDDNNNQTDYNNTDNTNDHLTDNSNWDGNTMNNSNTIE